MGTFLKAAISPFDHSSTRIAAFRNVPNAALLGCLTLAGCGWLNRSFIYHPVAEIQATPERAGLPFESVWVRVPDGPQLQAWSIPLASTSPVILLCHGNGGNISHRLLKAKLLRKAGFSVFLFDYRGFGRSTGKPTEEGTYADAHAAYGWLLAQGVPESRIVLYGESLGAAVAVEVASTRRPAGLILESPFTSAEDMARKLMPKLAWALKYRYDSLSKIGRVRAPLLVLHSPDDEIVPFAMGKRLYEAANQPKTFALLKGGHNDGFAVSAQIYVDALRAFLKTLPEDGVLR